MTIIFVALAVATITMTITRSNLFEGIRKTLNYKLIRCPYCAAHWISFGAWCCYPNVLSVFDFTINVFATVALSTLPMLVIDYFNLRMDKHAKILHSSRSTLL